MTESDSHAKGALSPDPTHLPANGGPPPVDRAGPILFFRGYRGGLLLLAALLVRPAGAQPPTVVADGALVRPETLLERDGVAVLRYTFSLAVRPGAGYTVDNQRYPVETDLDGDLRVAYVACNGQERGDGERSQMERNRLWRRLARQHASRPFHLLLQGGDQLYADEMLDVRPETREWAAGVHHNAKDPRELEAVRESLRSYLLARYLEIYTHDEPAWLMARVPSLCMWDDHDICDGWGSLPPEQLDAPVGRAVFGVAREFFLTFQLGADPETPPGICPDGEGRTLTWAAQLPDVAFVAPDLRSERRPERVMGMTGRNVFWQALEATAGSHVFVLSSVPALGPRLSWVETALALKPGVQKYEDDLRDQWQSRVHREEWRGFLSQLLALHEREDRGVTVLSGEIHLATRATMASRDGPLHQLVASGITHPPPPQAYARTLGALARLGESPLPGHPIRLHPLPGQSGIYTAQRNYLVLERNDGRWHAWWDLEEDGATAALPLD